MKKIAIINALIVIAIVVSFLSSCKWGQERPTPRSKNIICMVDFSDSKNAAERLQFYKSVIKNNILPTLRQYDKICIMPIDKASITNSSDIFQKDLSKQNFEPEMASPMEEEQLINANINKYRDSMLIEFENEFQTAIKNRNESQHGTDIFGALEVAKNSKLKEHDENYLILLSDMMNWSNMLDMETQNSKFNTNSINDILNKVPNHIMANVTALILTGKQVEVSVDHYKLVETFWRKYFEKAGIRLYDYNSASTSKLNELMSMDIEK